MVVLGVVAGDCGPRVEVCVGPVIGPVLMLLLGFIWILGNVILGIGWFVTRLETSWRSRTRRRRASRSSTVRESSTVSPPHTTRFAACPSCGREINVTLVQCPHCKSDLPPGEGVFR